MCVCDHFMLSVLNGDPDPPSLLGKAELFSTGSVSAQENTLQVNMILVSTLRFSTLQFSQYTSG